MKREIYHRFLVRNATVKNFGRTSEASQSNARADKNFNVKSRDDEFLDEWQVGRPIVTPPSEKYQGMEVAVRQLLRTFEARLKTTLVLLFQTGIITLTRKCQLF